MKRLGKVALLPAAGALLLTLACPGQAQATSIYKWVDKKGEVHFSQTPPPSGQAKQVNPDYAGPATPSDDEEAAPTTHQPPPKKEADDLNKPVTVVDKDQAKKACKAAREQLKQLRNPTNRLMTQGSDGKYRALTDAEIKARIKRAEQVENKACAQ